MGHVRCVAHGALMSDLPAWDYILARDFHMDEQEMVHVGKQIDMALKYRSELGLGGKFHVQIETAIQRMFQTCGTWCGHEKGAGYEPAAE